MVVTIARLGLRVCELMGLQWGVIDFGNLAVKVQRSFVEGHIYATKNEVSTTELPLDPDLAELLLRDMVTEDPTNSKFPAGTTSIEEKIASVYIQRGDFQAALGYQRTGIEMREALVKSNPTIVLYQAELAPSYQ